MDLEKRKIVVVGAGGHARVILSLLERLERWQIMGVLDRRSSGNGEGVDGHRIIGSWQDLGSARQRADYAVIAVGDNRQRKALYDSFKKAAFEIPILIHPSAYVDPSATLGEGCVVCMGSLIGTDVTVGSNSIVNSGAIVDHECRLENDVHIAPGVRLAGRVAIGEGTFVGIGATVIDKIRIGRGVVVGAGSVVLSDLPDGAVAYGVPARMKQAQT
ncbi:MAG: acetyltransferase [Candidatus Binatia bacterium]